MLGVAFYRVAVASTGVLPWSSPAAPPLPPPSSLPSTIGPAKWLNRCARSLRARRDDLTTGNLTVGELRHSHVIPALLLCSVSLTCGPNWLEGPACQCRLNRKLAHFFTDLNPDFMYLVIFVSLV